MKAGFTKLLVLFAFAGGLLGQACSLSAQPAKVETKDAPQGVRMFVCAHSFHIFVGRGLQGLASKEGIKGHELVGDQMIGGSSVTQHWNLPDDKNKAKKALESGKVDVLTLSPNLTVPDGAIELFTDLAVKHNPNIRVLVQASWFPWDSVAKEEKVTKNEERDGKTIAQLRPPVEGFRKGIEKQAEEINAKHKKQIVFVVPVGDAVLKLRELVIAGKVPGIKNQSDLFTDPIGHAKQPVMTLATYCHYSAIYKQKPTALPVGVDAKNEDQAALYRLLQTIAWDTVSNSPVSGVRASKAE